MAMRKENYFDKLDNLTINEDMTVKEAKEINRQKKLLTKKVQKLIIAEIRKITQYNDHMEIGHYYNFPNFKLKKTGAIKVEMMLSHSGWGDFGSIRRDERRGIYKIPMSTILK